MLSRDRKSSYKGSKVVVRWKELKPTASPGNLFIAGYLLTSEDGKQTHWRQFNAPTFHTYDTAAAYALREAHRFIDAQHSGSGKYVEGHPNVALPAPKPS